MDSKSQAQQGAQRPDGGYGDDSYLRDIDDDRVQTGRYYKLQLPDGSELGCRPYISRTERSCFISAGPANSGGLFCIGNPDEEKSTGKPDDLPEDASEWPVQESRKLFLRGLSGFDSDKAVNQHEDGRLWWGTDKHHKGSGLFYGDRVNGRNFIGLKGDSNIRLWVAEADGDSGHRFIRGSHGDALTFEVRFIFVCNAPITK